MAKTIIIFLCLFLVACDTFKTRPDFIVAECPAPKDIPRPELLVDKLKDADDPGTVIQAHRIDIKKLMGWGLEQEALLNGYRKKTK